MAQDNLLGTPDAADTSSLRLADIGTPEAGMLPLRLSDIMTPEGDERTTGDDGTVTDSGHEASAPSTATGGWQVPAQDRLGIGSDTQRRLRHEVRDLSEENQLLRLKLNLLQTNSNLKQVALIGTVISWFGDKGLLDDDINAVYTLTSMMMPARAADEHVSPAFTERSNATAGGPRQSRRTDNGPMESPEKSVVQDPKFRSPESNAGYSLNDNTSEWPSQSLDASFNPPFSSSKKEMRYPVALQGDETLLAGGGTDKQRGKRGTSVIPAGSELQNGAEANVDSLDESTKRLDSRIQQMEDAVSAFAGRQAETKSYIARLRQNATKRFRVWKAIEASRNLAAADLSLDDDDEASNEELATLGEQSITPTPLTQYLSSRQAEETGNSNVVHGTPSRKILGEIAFQVERRILAFVFQRKEILYGYNLGNLEIMIRTHPDQGGRSVLHRRYELLMDVLRSYGWVRGRHARFIADVIARYGTLRDVESAKAEALKRGWSNPSELKRGVLCLCPVMEVLDMLVVLDCLLHMARNDGQPVFLW
ncbi:uncharacterized protein LOC110975955 [Acanthaster planci]|uniref:Uncharacterized protein LOC110975955 n=1 Tax=Acanthaster planci TaxID=133434 RepID=A0A8B7XUL2_ACAPL|nr:uncharacterized protein LOC110975955 [Acanthaster planci]